MIQVIKNDIQRDLVIKNKLIFVWNKNARRMIQVVLDSNFLFYFPVYSDVGFVLLRSEDLDPFKV
jgi:hypothetical protein